MIANTSRQFLIARPTILCLSACLVGSLRAQNYSPIVNDRVLADGMDAPVVDDLATHRGGLEIEAVLSVAYDSNIFLSRKNPVEDLVTRVGPAVAYTKGDPIDGEGGFIKFAYQPTGVIYADNRQDNRIDQVAALTAGWRWTSTSLTYTVAARKLGDAIPDTGQQTDRVEFDHEVLAAWTPREKVTFELAAGNRSANYSDPTLFDSNETYAKAAVRYAYSPKTRIGVACQVGRLQVDGGSDQTLQQITVDFAWQPRQKINVALQLGAEHRNTQDGSEINPVVEGRIDWTPRSGTQLYLTGYQRQEASAYYAGQNYQLAGVSAGLSQRVGKNWTARLEAGREKVTYSQVSGSGLSGRSDTIWFVRPAFEYKITDALDVTIFYRISNDSSSVADFGYRQQLAGVSLNYKF